MTVRHAPEAGDRARELRGLTAAGKRFDLAVRRRPVLVEFHRGTW